MATIVTRIGKGSTLTTAEMDANLTNLNTDIGTRAVASDMTTALGLKAPSASPTFTGTVSGVTATHVGLGNVDNTSDVNKPVSTATQTALNSKAPNSMFAAGSVMEVGRYFDFHGTTSANDYDVRFDAGSTPGANGGGTMTVTCVTFSVSGSISGGTVTQTSDERLKTNWKQLPENFLDNLSKVKSGIYDRTDIISTQVGVSAQSLQEILPDAILEDEKGMLSVNYGGAALAACVELAKEVKFLRERIFILENQ